MWLYRCFPALRPLWSLYWRFRLTGAVDSIPRSGPLLVAANHACFLDPWFLAVVFPRPIHYLINRKWFYRSRSWTWFFEAQGGFALGETLADTAEIVRGMLDAGEVVCVFPEGKISRDGRMQKFHAGISHFAAASGAPVLPVGITGAYETLPRSRRFPRPGKITFRVGEPIHYPGSPVAERIPNRRALEFRDDLFRAISRLVGDAHLPELSAPRAVTEPVGRTSPRRG